MVSRVLSGPHIQPLAPSLTEATITFAGASVEVVSIRLDTEAAALSEFARCLSDSERLRASRFAFERDRCRFIVRRAGLRYLLAARLGVEPDAIELIYGARGKPALSRRFADSDLRFNVSHSEGTAVYAFSHGREIGVDVEALCELPDADDVAARFFSAKENEAYLALPPRDKPLGFLNCWTRKEAFIKALGDGLYYPLDRFDVSLAPGEPAKILQVAGKSGNDCEWAVRELILGTGFIGALVAQKHSQQTCSKVASRT